MLPKQFTRFSKFLLTVAETAVQNCFAILSWAVAVGSKGDLMAPCAMRAVTVAVWVVAGAAWAVAASMWTVAASMWTVADALWSVTASMHAMEAIFELHRCYVGCYWRCVGCCSLHACYAGAMWADTSSMWAVTSSMWDVTSEERERR